MLAAGAALLGSSFVDDPPEPKTTQKREGQLIRFEDREKKLSIAYPATWQRVGSRDPQVSLVVGSLDASLLMRTASLGTPVAAEAIGSAKRLTDRLVKSGTKVKQLRPPRRIDDLGGLPGWLYIYSFEDAATGRRGAHAHYFLFRGETMITLVFQTLPSERFTTYAPLFDRLASSFRATLPEGGGEGGAGDDGA